jgi:hypothetical protein
MKSVALNSKQEVVEQENLEQIKNSYTVPQIKKQLLDINTILVENNFKLVEVHGKKKKSNYCQALLEAREALQVCKQKIESRKKAKKKQILITTEEVKFHKGEEHLEEKICKVNLPQPSNVVSVASTQIPLIPKRVLPKRIAPIQMYEPPIHPQKSYPLAQVKLHTQDKKTPVQKVGIPVGKITTVDRFFVSASDSIGLERHLYKSILDTPKEEEAIDTNLTNKEDNDPLLNNYILKRHLEWDDEVNRIIQSFESPVCEALEDF